MYACISATATSNTLFIYVGGRMFIAGLVEVEVEVASLLYKICAPIRLDSSGRCDSFKRGANQMICLEEDRSPGAQR